MEVFCDDIKFLKRYFSDYEPVNSSEIKNWLKYFFGEKNIDEYNIKSDFKLWDTAVLVKEAENSQYDTLIELNQSEQFKQELLCLAGAGKRFHGFKNRKWNSEQGNIHLSANFKPNRELQNFSLGFLILSAVSVVQTIDDIQGLNGKAEIKWVNDVVIDGKKVSGVLAHCLTQGKIIKDAIIGIGLNVEVNPKTEPTLFVPKSACLNDFLDDNNRVNEKSVFANLIKHLIKNYKLLLSGGYFEILKIYKERSVILGKEVSIWTDKKNKDNVMICKGRVKNIGDLLELEIEGYNKKIINGRLAIEENL